MNKASKIIISILGVSTVTAGVINYKLGDRIKELEEEVNEKNGQSKLMEIKHDDLGKELIKIKDDKETIEIKNKDIDKMNQYLIDLFNGFNRVTFEQMNLIPSNLHGSAFPKSQLHYDLIGLGLPSSENLWFYESYVSSLNFERKVPNWVCQRIKFEDFKDKIADRKYCNFNNNTIQVPQHFKQENKDYWGSGWSKGHMVPAGDNIKSQESMCQTFLLNSNIVPQDLHNNQNFWYRLESFCKNQLVSRFKSVTIISGPVYHHPNLIEQLDENQLKSRPKYSKQTQKKFVKYEVIGDRNVAVPNYLYKIILVEPKDQDDNNNNKPYLVGSFLIPNEPIPSDSVLTDYEVPLHEIEVKTGLQFFKKLNPKTDIQSLCESNPINCVMMAEKELLPRLIGFCRSTRDINDLKNDYKHINWDDNLTNLLNSKSLEVQQIEDLKKQEQSQKLLKTSNNNDNK
ncbi:hypothetical protein RB653_008130 [Dictyostelium firmibasis]|uniref:Uncharacterized protein n=1 Tax=Dictyostelium firmibasis TaxID=79012 RepID=A0AAN7TS97_9MYCE